MVIKRRKVNNIYEIWLCDVSIENGKNKITYIEKIGDESDLLESNPNAIHILKQKYESVKNDSSEVVKEFKASDVSIEKVKTTETATQSNNSTSINITIDRSINPKILALSKSSKDTIFEKVRKLTTSKINFDDIFNVGYKYIEDIYNKFEINKFVTKITNPKANEYIKYLLYIRMLFPDNYINKYDLNISFFDLPKLSINDAFKAISDYPYDTLKVRNFLKIQYKATYKSLYNESFHYKAHYFENNELCQFIDAIASFILDVLNLEINKYAPSKRSALDNSTIFRNLQWACVTTIQNNLLAFIDLEPDLILVSHILNRPILGKFITIEELNYIFK